MISLPADPARIQTRVAIQGVCAWPNLQQLPDGTLLVIIYNQPVHGRWEGELDCWASTDQGRVWRFRGRVIQHQPGTNRMNCAVGPAANGDLVVLCSGYTNRIPNPLQPFAKAAGPRGKREFLPTRVCRSPDGGQTWQVTEQFSGATRDGTRPGKSLCPIWKHRHRRRWIALRLGLSQTRLATGLLPGAEPGRRPDLGRSDGPQPVRE